LSSAIAQPREQKSLDEFYSYGDSYFIEVTTLPAVEAVKTRAIVSFRLSYDLLNFRKSDQSYRREAGVYMATPSMFVEAVGSDGVIADRGLWRDTVRVQEFSETNAKQRFSCGSVELLLRPGVYQIKYLLEDESPVGMLSDELGPIKIDDFNARSPAIGLPLFLRSITADTLTAASIDGNALFGAPLLAYVPLASTNRPDQLRYEIIRDMPDRAVGEVQLSGFGTLLGRTTLQQPFADGDHLRFVLQEQSDADSSVRGGRIAHEYGALISASANELLPGDYLMLIHFEAGNTTVRDSVRFKLRWIDMPLSLTRVDYAIAALYPIATDQTLDSLRDGNVEQQERALLNYWKRHDPTPATAYNEAMAEYYRRVDYALFNFRSIGQKDGVHTDRGKIYMLYGPPTEVTRQLQPDESPREVWIYRNAVSSEFIFVDESRSGEYRLVEHHTL
jgi:GWxTD domain-containing protein